MPYLNRAQIIGHVGKAPETKQTTGGTSVTTFSVATNEYYNDKQTTDWHRIVAWGKVSDIASKLDKGEIVFVEGKMKTRSWEDKSGVKRYITEINARSIRAANPHFSPALTGPYGWVTCS